MKIYRTHNIYSKSINVIMDRLKVFDNNIMLRNGNFCTEIISGNKLFILPAKNKKTPKSVKKEIYIFAMVRRDAKKYFESKNGIIKLPKKANSIEYAKKINNLRIRKIAGADLNHAYWQIAYKLGIISKNTYESGLNLKNKQVRLAALSTIGVGKTYNKFKNGTVDTKNKKVIGRDEEFIKVYTLIRYTCYKYMNRLKKILGDDFIAYKVDCIYYKYNLKNEKIVNDFFKKNNLMIKKLE